MGAREPNSSPDYTPHQTAVNFFEGLASLPCKAKNVGAFLCVKPIANMVTKVVTQIVRKVFLMAYLREVDTSAQQRTKPGRSHLISHSSCEVP